MKSKASQIRELYDGVRSTAEIAEIVGCLPEYVRIVARQRKSGGVSDIDRRYKTSEKGAKVEAQLKVGRRARQRARNRILSQTADNAAVREIARLAYKKARLDGQSYGDAQRASKLARSLATFRLGDQAAARLAGSEAYKAVREESK